MQISVHMHPWEILTGQNGHMYHTHWLGFIVEVTVFGRLGSVKVDLMEILFKIEVR